MIQKAEMEFGGQTIHPVTDSDIVLHNGGSLTTAINNAQNYNPAPSASAFGQQILACNSAQDVRNLLKVMQSPIIDETGTFVTFDDVVRLSDDNTADGFGKTVYCPANNFFNKAVSFSNDSFTLDFFMKITSESGNLGYFTIYIPNQTGVGLRHSNASGHWLAKLDSSWTIIGSGGYGYGTARRFHRITYDGGVWKWYVDGVLKQSGTYNITDGLQGKTLIFRFGSSVATYYDEIRILEGVVLTTDVPTAPFSISEYPTQTRCLIHCD